METALELPTESSRTHLNEIITSILDTNDFNLNISMGSSVGDNYIGVVYRVKATKNDRNDSKDGKSGNLSVIVKLPPQNAARREQFFVGPCFVREIWIYDELLPLFQQFQKGKGIDTTVDGFFEFAKCYRTVGTEMDEALFFEDLKTSGFEMHNRLEDISIEHVQLVMQGLGKFHALSFALRDQQPEKFDSFKSLTEIFMNRQDDQNFTTYMKTLTERARATLSPDTHAGLIEKFTSLFEGKELSVMLDLLNGSLSEPYAVVCHGDCWNNNLLFKYDSNGKPNGIRFLDWQIARYASPACDISHYLFCCTTKKLRDQHYESLLKIYYKSFSDLLNRLGSDAEKLFSFEALLNEMKKNGRYGILIAMVLLPLITSVADDIPDLDEVSEKIRRGDKLDAKLFIFEKTEDVYNTKMRDIILDMDRLGYI
ncbi:hypothetical protein Bhyg_10890 [Pseudolycoriella hygida]|uniref:CHK kinase-like domain-containing protein n=1 Tax=Pseudolycoriella hygida TaxID=35572 RepID=A0A9Q0MX06_9DIPT|nr:hypothetical protein Bhyg_10890 [Pseudolycoriella hygida]